MSTLQSKTRSQDKTAPPETVAELEVAAEEEESRSGPHGSTCAATCEGGNEAPHHARTYTFEALDIDDVTVKVTAELWGEPAVLLSLWSNGSDSSADVSLSLPEAQHLIDFLHLAMSGTLWDHWQQQTGYGAPSIPNVA